MLILHIISIFEENARCFDIELNQDQFVTNIVIKSCQKCGIIDPIFKCSSITSAKAMQTILDANSVCGQIIQVIGYMKYLLKLN